MVTYLNEFPTVIEGDFDPSFLELPDEILITVMRGHQKYFAVEKRSGELAPHFPGSHQPREGCARTHSRRARTGVASALRRCPILLGVGSKMSSSPTICRSSSESPTNRGWAVTTTRSSVCGRSRVGSPNSGSTSGMVQAHVADADRAAELAKCDLVTDMVKEFTELQGVVGGLYCRAQGESEDVADAVYDHYRPVGLDDPIPRNITGCAVALADKFDSIVGCFTVGVVPTGSSDPYALRRAATGNREDYPGAQASRVAVPGDRRGSEGVAHAPAEEAPHTRRKKSRCWSLFWTARKFVLREKSGYAYDEVNAVFRAGSRRSGGGGEAA